MSRWQELLSRWLALQILILRPSRRSGSAVARKTATAPCQSRYA